MTSPSQPFGPAETSGTVATSPVRPEKVTWRTVGLGARFIVGLRIAVACAYPGLVYWGLQSDASARFLALGLLLFFAPALVSSLRRWRGARAAGTVLTVPLAVVSGFLLAAVSGDEQVLRLVPVWVNVMLLLSFGHTLWRGPSMIERFARLTAGALNSAQVAHCRQWTVVWVGFFVVNAAIALLTALVGTRFLWAAYNAGLVYALMGLLFAGEFLMRRFRFREYSGQPWDRWLARLWPPRTLGPEAERRASLDQQGGRL